MGDFVRNFFPQFRGFVELIHLFEKIVHKEKYGYQNKCKYKGRLREHFHRCTRQSYETHSITIEKFLDLDTYNLSCLSCNTNVYVS